MRSSSFRALRTGVESPCRRRAQRRRNVTIVTGSKIAASGSSLNDREPRNAPDPSHPDTRAMARTGREHVHAQEGCERSGRSRGERRSFSRACADTRQLDSANTSGLVCPPVQWAACSLTNQDGGGPATTTNHSPSTASDAECAHSATTSRRYEGTRCPISKQTGPIILQQTRAETKREHLIGRSARFPPIPAQYRRQAFSTARSVARREEDGRGSKGVIPSWEKAGI